MSSPDKVIELKTKVQTYEKELQDAFTNFSKSTQEIEKKPTESGIKVTQDRLNRVNEITWKLIVVYREYTKELEKLAPRP